MATIETTWHNARRAPFAWAGIRSCSARHDGAVAAGVHAGGQCTASAVHRRGPGDFCREFHPQLTHRCGYEPAERVDVQIAFDAAHKRARRARLQSLREANVNSSRTRIITSASTD